MKHLNWIGLALSAILAVALFSCGTVNSATGGLADEAYLKIVSDNKTLIDEPVVVTINGTNPTETKVIQTKGSEGKKPQFYLNPGTYSIAVKSKEGRVLYSGKIFLSTRKTKLIELR